MLQQNLGTLFLYFIYGYEPTLIIARSYLFSFLALFWLKIRVRQRYFTVLKLRIATFGPLPFLKRIFFQVYIYLCHLILAVGAKEMEHCAACFDTWPAMKYSCILQKFSASRQTSWVNSDLFQNCHQRTLTESKRQEEKRQRGSKIFVTVQTCCLVS